MRTLVFFMALSLPLYFSAVAQPKGPKGVTSANFYLYLLAGQSNMAGRGKVDMTDKAPNPRIWMLNKANEWVPATDPLHFDKPTMVGVGPGLSFARQLLDQLPDTAGDSIFIGLIPAAVGGSPIDAWQPGAFYEPTNSHPYDDAVKRVQYAQQSGTLAGILWHQGEGDSKPELTTTYQQKLVQLIGRFRLAFNAPNVPVVVGTLGDFFVKRTPEAAQINTILKNLPNQVAQVGCADASGLTDNGDQVHFNAESAQELGRRYANVMKMVQPIRKKP